MNSEDARSKRIFGQKSFSRRNYQSRRAEQPRHDDNDPNQRSDTGEWYILLSIIEDFCMFFSCGINQKLFCFSLRLRGIGESSDDLLSKQSSSSPVHDTRVS